MSIPRFHENGLLPPGLHLAKMDEIEILFGKSTQRRKELFQWLQNFVELAKHCGALRILVDGSFVTAKPEPKDVDVVIWLGAKYLSLLDQEDVFALRLKKCLILENPKKLFL